jgi:hypothetical protein
MKDVTKIDQHEKKYIFYNHALPFVFDAGL